MKTTVLASLALAACCSFALATPEAPANQKARVGGEAAPRSSSAPTQAAAPQEGAAAKPAAAKKGKLSAARAEAALVEKFVTLQDEAISCFQELGETLEGVTDKESADAAAPEVAELAERLCDVILRVEALGEPSEAVQQAIMARLANKEEKEDLVEEVMLPLLDLMMMEPPCYGSESLNTELTFLLESLQGAAGVDEGDEAAPLAEPDADEAAANAAAMGE